jgi:hypothetical protein
MRTQLDKFIELSEELAKQMWDRSDRTGTTLSWLECFDDAVMEIMRLREQSSQWEKVVAAVCNSEPTESLVASEWVRIIKDMANEIPEKLRPAARAAQRDSVISKMSGLIAWAGRRP